MKKAIYVVIALSLFACKKEVISNQPGSINNEKSTTASSSIASLISANYTIIFHAATPKQTDAAIVTNSSGDVTQTAYLPQNASARKDRLLIFIPGTFGLPSNYDEVCEAAAANGYYAFAVAYSNLLPVEFEAGVKTNDSTVENILHEDLTGENVSSKVTTSRTNSFENRIIKMISYMDSVYPAENWKRFLTADKQIQWNKISVGGHSQGSDHAMYWSKVRSLFRATFIGGPGSFMLRNGSYPSFMQATGATSTGNLYGFNHTGDPTRKWADVQKVWMILNIPGVPNSVDDGSVDNSHQLITSLPDNDPHSATIADDVTPINAATGKPVYSKVWQYMMFP